jgi:alpha-tubulin suppressor-like RCC1 family protein
LGRGGSEDGSLGEWKDWVEISAGDYHTCGRRSDRSLWCWGRNDSGQLGVGDRGNRDAPVRVGVWSDWVEVSAGDDHTCGRRSDGSLWCWGDNNYGQMNFLEETVSADQLTPVRVPGATDWREVSAGRSRTCGRRAAGVWCFGGDEREPRPPEQLDPRRWLTISHERNTCGVRIDQSLWCRGSGNGTGVSRFNVDQFTAVRVYRAP